MNEPYGYYTSYGYRGYVKRLERFLMFATEQDYYEYIGC